MQNSTYPRPRLIDRVRAAVDAFRHPRRAYVQGVRAGLQMFPQIAADLNAR